MADDRKSEPQRPQVRSVPGDIYKMGQRAAGAVRKWQEQRKAGKKRSAGSRG